MHQWRIMLWWQSLQETWLQIVRYTNLGTSGGHPRSPKYNKRIRYLVSLLRFTLHHLQRQHVYVPCTGPSDYQHVEQNVTFTLLTGVTRCVNIPIENDERVENVEFFLVLLSTSSSELTILTPSAVVAITDDDSKYPLSLCWVIECMDVDLCHQKWSLWHYPNLCLCLLCTFIHCLCMLYRGDSKLPTEHLHCTGEWPSSSVCKDSEWNFGSKCTVFYSNCRWISIMYET